MYVWRTSRSDTLLVPSAIVEIGTSQKDQFAVDWTGALAGTGGDTPASCAVSIVTGSCQLAPTLGGSYSTTAAATVSSMQTSVALKSATAGTLQLLWLLTSTGGRIIPVVHTFNVVSR